MIGDPVVATETLFAACTNVTGEEQAFYLARARMAAVEARERLEIVERMIAAREREIVRLSKVKP